MENHSYKQARGNFMKKIYIILFAVVINQYMALCCDCIMTPLLWHYVDSYDIIIGDVVSRKDTVSLQDRQLIKSGIPVDTNTTKNISFRITNKLKGNIRDSIIEFKGSSNCDFTFRLGKKYLLFIDNKQQVKHCSYSEIFNMNSDVYVEILKFTSINFNDLLKTVTVQKNSYYNWADKQKKLKKSSR